MICKDTCARLCSNDECDCTCHSPLSARYVFERKMREAVRLGVEHNEPVASADDVMRALDIYTLALSKELVEKIEAGKITPLNIGYVGSMTEFHEGKNKAKDEDIAIIKDTLEAKSI